jgi:hypothetical protein
MALGWGCEALESRTYFAINLNAATNFPDLTSPSGLVEAAFTPDGTPAVAAAGINPNTNLPTVAVYIGGATPPVYYDLPAGQRAFDLVAADFDGTNGIDLAVSDPITGTVSVLLNNGDGTFAAPVVTQFGTAQPAGSTTVAYLATGDFNNDGNPDLAVTDPADHQIVILLNHGGGTFTAGTPITLPEPSFTPQHIVTAVFSSSGSNDLAFNDGTTPQVYLALGNGSGAFGTPTPTSVDGAVQGMSTGDINLDSTTDLAVSTTTGTAGSVDVLISNNGVFAPAISLPTTYPDPGPIVVADIDGDGVPDIATLNAAGNLDLFQGEFGGNPSAAVATQVTSGTPQALIAADVDGDGKADLIFSQVNTAITNNGGFGLVFGAGDPIFSATLSGTAPASAIAGQRLKFFQTVNLTNISGTLATGADTITLALSTDPTFSFDDTAIGSIARKFNVRAEKGHAVRLLGTLPTTLAAGTYYLVAQVTDHNGGITSTVGTKTIVIQPAVIDLSGTFTTAKPGRAGKPLNAVIRITNNGNVSAVGKLPIVVDTSMVPDLDSSAVMAIAPTRAINIRAGKSLVLKLARLIAPATPGTYYLIVQLDPNNTLADTNTANNTLVSAGIAVS